MHLQVIIMLQGVYSENDKKPGWWNHVVGPGKAIDTNKFFVICSNCLGACKGSTGPSSKKANGETYGMSFPDLSILDMVRAQKLLLDHLGVSKLFAVVGGSMGGMQALQWIVEYPRFFRKSHYHCSDRTAHSSNHCIQRSRQAFDCGRPRTGKRESTMKREGPHKGLAVARMMAHITYLSDHGMEEKFGGSKDWILNENLNSVFSDIWITKGRNSLIGLMPILI